MSGYQQHVQVPTHKAGHTLDLVISRIEGLSITTLGVDLTVSSDHYAVIFTAAVEKPPVARKTTEVRDWKCLDMERFTEDIGKSCLSQKRSWTVSQATDS